MMLHLSLDHSSILTAEDLLRHYQAGDRSFIGVWLSQLDLSHAMLASINLKGAKLIEANLSNAVCTNSDLSFADLFMADLRGADLSGADLRHANLSYANLLTAKLTGAKLAGADLRGTIMPDGKMLRLLTLEQRFRNASGTLRSLPYFYGNQETCLKVD